MNFEDKLSLNNPVTDYTKLMDEKMKANVIIPNDVFIECWDKISTAARDTIWKLLFDDKKPADKEQLAKAAELMKMHKEDVCFYQAGEYNNWVIKVRDELLKRNMLDFWKNEMVQKELGPCWARDSDLFDNPEDPEPANFYEFADCKAPWLDEKSKIVEQNPADLVASVLLSSPKPKSTKPLKKITIETPSEDYNYNMEYIDGDDEEECKIVFEEARNMVWQLLFGESTLSSENSKKASDLLEEYKRYACFYNPWDYNDWIPKVRDELLKRKYFDFWQDVMVKKELGLCCARDCDYFDDHEDSEPANFYKFADCKAPWLDEKPKVIQQNPVDLVASALFNPPKPKCAKSLKNITIETLLEDYITRVNHDVANFEAKLSLNNPVADYTKLMDEKVKPNVIIPNDVFIECWNKISAAARDTIWKLLFDDKESADKEQLEKAVELMKIHKDDACFYQAGEYNNWVFKVRDELLKRNMLDFWKNEMVQKKLGPCWARNWDLFGDTEDPEAANFYKFVDCKAPWLDKKLKVVEQNPADLLPSPKPLTAKSLKKITIETPLEDYKYNMEDIDGDDEKEWRIVFEEARNMVWQLLFGESTLSSENSKKAADLLEEYKRYACFYDPWDYNDWIPKVRDELLKRKYFDFWQDVMVKKELGFCCARDCDYFDDHEDSEPANFYKFADCKAPWLDEKPKVVQQNPADLVASALFNPPKPKCAKSLKKITIETPLEDYKYNMAAIDGNNEEAFKTVFQEARNMVGQLLFGESTLSCEYSKKASDLLEEYKRDACFYNPWDYNDWIPNVRDELLRRKYFDFWQDVMVKKELGLCCARDSDNFNDIEDSEPQEFYKDGKDFIKQQKK